MNPLLILSTILATTYAGHLYKQHNTLENYSKTAEIYQSGLEHQQQYAGHAGGFAGQGGHIGQGGLIGQGGHIGQGGFLGGRPEEKGARVLTHQYDNNGHGYQYTYETENGIKAQETANFQGKSLAVQGGYSYTGDDGQVYSVSYTADETGFHPSGAHIPTPPPLPEAIAKGLEQNAKDEANGVYDDGSYKEALQTQSLPDQHYQQDYNNYQQTPQYTEAYQQTSGYESQGPQGSQAPQGIEGYHTVRDQGAQNGGW